MTRGSKKCLLNVVKLALKFQEVWTIDFLDQGVCRLLSISLPCSPIDNGRKDHYKVIYTSFLVNYHWSSPPVKQE